MLNHWHHLLLTLCWSDKFRSSTHYHTAFQDEVTFTFWPCANPWYLNTDPIMIMVFHLPFNHHHHTAHTILPSIIMSHPDTDKSYFEDPFDIEMQDLPTQPRHTLWITSSLHSLKSIWPTMQLGQCPIKALPVVPQLTPNNMPIIPITPINHSFLHIYNPRKLIWEKIFQSWEQNEICGNWEQRSRLLLDHMPYGLHRNRVRNTVC